MFTTPAHATVQFEPLQHAIKHVFLAVPLSQDREAKQMATYIVGSGGREELYNQFIRDFRPQLTETEFDELAGKRFSLRKLVVPTKEVKVTGRGFLVDAENYFFKRGVSTTAHPALKKAPTPDSSDRWLERHRGKNFIVELRKQLRAFCEFQARNWEVINAFARFAFLAFSDPSAENKKMMKGWRKVAADGGLPPGVAERLLDFFYLGEKEDDFSLESLSLTLGDDQWEWVADDAKFRATFPKLANAFRAALLGDPGPYPSLPWARLAGEALKGNPTLPDADDSKIQLKATSINPADFRSSRDALRVILEMLPSRALPQEALAWVLEELFEVACGTAHPVTTRQYGQIAKTITNGDPTGTQVAKPALRVLADKDRQALRKNVLDKIEGVVDIITEEDTAEPGEAGKKMTKPVSRADKLGALLGKASSEALLSDAGFQNLLQVLVPQAKNVRQSERKQMIKGAKLLFRLAFETRVIPELFGSPALDFRALMDRIKGQNYGLMLVAVSLFGQSDFAADEALAELARTEKRLISTDIENVWNSERSAHRAVELVVKTLKAMGKGAGALKDTVNLWVQAQNLLEICPAATESTVVSSMQNLRPQASVHAIAASPPLLGRELVRRLAVAKTNALQKLRDTREKQIAAEQAAKESKAEVEKAEAEAKIEKKDAAAASRAGDAVVFAQAKADRAENAATKTLDEYNAALNDARGAGGPPAAGANASSSSRSVVEDKVDQIFRDLGLTIDIVEKPSPKSVPKDFSKVVASVVEKYESNPANAIYASDVLQAYENLNQQVYAVYAKVKNEPGNRRFAREVEAMTLGRIIAAMKERCGLGEDGSGLLKLLLDLMQGTGMSSANGDDVHGTELLKDHSLYDYLDGAFLQDGQLVAELADSLSKCAHDSFANITSYISELQAIHYLFHQAPAGTKITLFNDRGGEFWEWLENEHLSKIGPFSVNSRQSQGGLPGLVYISREVAASFKGLTLRKGDYAFLLPPVLVQNPAFGTTNPPFPWLSVGPDLPLNSDADMKTKLPAPYPILLRFLHGFSVRPEDRPSLGLAEQSFAEEEPYEAGFRQFKVKGAGPSLDSEVEALFTSTWGDGPGKHSFASDYHLYLVLRLYADCLIQAPAAERMAGAAWRGSYFDHWYQTDPAGPWARLDDPRGNSLVRCFPSGTAKEFCFNTNLAPLLPDCNGAGLFLEPLPPPPAGIPAPEVVSEFDWRWFLTTLRAIN